MVMTSDETQIQIFANWPMSHAKRVTRDNRKNPEYRVIAAIRKLRTDTNCPAGESWPNHVKNEQHIGSEYFTACYTVLKRPNKVETAVHGCNLAFSLDYIVSLPR